MEAARTALEAAEAVHADAVKAYDKRAALEEARAALPVAPVEPDADARKAGTPGVRVVRESLTYEKNSGVNYFRDVAEMKVYGTREATERVHKHTDEMRVEGRALVYGEQRVNPSQTAGQGGEFIPPLWLMDEWVAVQRAARPIANTMNLRPLPPGTNQINLPKVSTGTTIAVQTDAGAVSSTDITTTSVTGQVQTVAGQQNVSIQLMDLSQPGIDQVIFDDLARAYATQLDSLAITGSVTNAKGINQLPGTNPVTYTQATPTAATLYPKVADGVQRIHTGRFLPPQIIAMHPRRWGNLLASLDSQNRPLIVPNGDAFNAMGVLEHVAAENVVGGLQGLPVVVDSSIPTTQGASTNQDQIYVYRADDLYLYESEPRLRVLEEVLSNTLQVKFQIYGYYAIILGRLPLAISVIDGTGLVTPTF